MELLCDWHVHSCLSPCGSLDMSPDDIAAAAAARGLNSVALTDHNNAHNVPAFAEVCRRRGLHALYGMEITTAEEIHCLALFGDPDAAVAAGAEIEARLPPFRNIPEKLGDQPVVDVEGNILYFVDVYLGNATDLTFTELPRWVDERGGLFVPAHIDRDAFSVLSALGELPPESGPILECTRFGLARMAERYGGGRALLCHSDAHQLDAIGAAHTRISLADGCDATLAAIRDAILDGQARPVSAPPNGGAR